MSADAPKPASGGFDRTDAAQTAENALAVAAMRCSSQNLARSNQSQISLLGENQIHIIESSQGEVEKVHTIAEFAEVLGRSR